jgi:hypothetical protein
LELVDLEAGEGYPLVLLHAFLSAGHGASGRPMPRPLTGPLFWHCLNSSGSMTTTWAGTRLAERVVLRRLARGAETVHAGRCRFSESYGNRYLCTRQLPTNRHFHRRRGFLPIISGCRNGRLVHPVRGHSLPPPGGLYTLVATPPDGLRRSSRSVLGVVGDKRL